MWLYLLLHDMPLPLSECNRSEHRQRRREKQQPSCRLAVGMVKDSWGNSHNTRLLSFTFSASRYTLLPISLNLALICAMPASMVPLMFSPTPVGSFSVAA